MDQMCGPVQCMVPPPPESNKYWEIFTAYIYITHLHSRIILRIYIRNQNMINNSIIHQSFTKILMFNYIQFYLIDNSNSTFESICFQLILEIFDIR